MTASIFEEPAPEAPSPETRSQMIERARELEKVLGIDSAAAFKETDDISNPLVMDMIEALNDEFAAEQDRADAAKQRADVAEQRAAAAEEAPQEAWIKKWLEELGPELRDAEGEYRLILGINSIGSSYGLQYDMEADMIQASHDYEEAYGVHFPAMDDDDDGYMVTHGDVGDLSYRLEDWFKSHGATDEDIKNLYDEGE